MSKKYEMVRRNDLGIFSRHPEVENIVRGQTSGERAAQGLFELIKNDPESVMDRALICDKVSKLTSGEVNECPSGFVLYNHKYRLLVVNELKNEYNDHGGKARMFDIGGACLHRGLVYKYLRGIGSDNGVGLIICLPLMPDQRPRATEQEIINRALEVPVVPEPEMEVLKQEEIPKAPKVVRVTKRVRKDVPEFVPDESEDDS